MSHTYTIYMYIDEKNICSFCLNVILTKREIYSVSPRSHHTANFC